MSARDVPIEIDQPHDSPSIYRLANGEGLSANFQPIASLCDGRIVGYEGLIRGPAGSRLHSPPELFRAARRLGYGLALEMSCAREITSAFAALGLAGMLAVNFSASTIERLAMHGRDGLGFLRGSGISPGRVMIELTEHDHVADVSALRSHVDALRARGFALALDDFGNGHSSLRLWSELAPEVVKIDRYFIGGVRIGRGRLECVKAMLRLAEAFGTRLLAEGLEDEADLRVVRELGIELGQGYLLGRPGTAPARYSTSTATT